jgi:TPR repeat protein
MPTFARLVASGAAALALALAIPAAQAQKPPPFKETLAKAEQGDLKAQFNIGLMYENGDGVPKNMAKAFEWYERAAERYLPEAQNGLGWLYLNGQGTAKDMRRACVWLTLASEKNIDNTEDRNKACKGLNATDRDWVKDQVRARRGTMI